MDLININEKKVLVDRLELMNIKILKIDNIDKLIRLSLLENSQGGIKYVTPSDNEFTRLHIKDNLVELVAGAKAFANKRVEYCNLTVTLHNNEFGNLKCLTVSEYKEHLQTILSHLKSKYSVVADLSDAKIKLIEINKTFALNQEYENYNRVLTLIMANLPQRYKNQSVFIINNACRDIETTYASSGKSSSARCMIFKIYNKSKSVSSKIIVSQSYMRVELTIKGQDKINNDFQINKLNELTDLIITNFYYNQTQKLVVATSEEFYKYQKRTIKKIILEQKEQSRYWVKNTLRILTNEEIKLQRPILLDVEELKDILKDIFKDSKKVSKHLKSFRDQSQKFETVFSNRDDLKYKEIIDKILAREES